MSNLNFITYKVDASLYLKYLVSSNIYMIQVLQFCSLWEVHLGFL